MIAELATLLAETDPETSDSPVGRKTLALVNPRWYTHPDENNRGSVLYFRDPGLGWRALILPWGSLTELMSLLTVQIGMAISSNSQPGGDVLH